MPRFRMAGRAAQKKGVVSGAHEEDLFGRLVHDLRNPLGVIAYFAEAVATASGSEHDELCVRLRVNAQRALHVLEEFSLLSDLRTGAQRAAERGDVRELIEEVATELESMERRPGRIHRDVQLDTPRGIARQPVGAALRALLRIALHVSAPEDIVGLAVHEEGRQIVMAITVPLRTDRAIGVAVRLPSRGIEIELAQRVAAQHGGRYAVELRPGIGRMILAVAPRD